MTQRVFNENAGEIVIHNEECFWIFPTYNLTMKNEIMIDTFSPWFSYIGEKWRFALFLSSNYEQYGWIYLWRKFHRDLRDHKYTVQLKLKNLEGQEIKHHIGDFDCNYGYTAKSFVNRRNLLNKDGLAKIFFNIEEKFPVEEISLSTCTEKSNGSNRENEAIANDEVSSEEDDEKKNISSKDAGVAGLIKNLENLLVNEWGSDVILKNNDHEFRAHMNILGARSPVFASMFQHDMIEKKTGEVDISDCSTVGFKVFLQFLYSGKADISSENVVDLYYIADKYQVDDLKLYCVEFMKHKLTVDNFCDVIALSLRHSESDLQKYATQFFCYNIKKIVKTVQWQKYMDENSTHANELIIKAINA